jgi:YesN/AraC family two-component response regulator
MKTILIVDDEPLLRDCLRDVLSAQRYIVLEASNGAEALMVVRTQTVDLILTDVDMPVKNGIEFLKEFRAINQTTPVIVMSGGHVLSIEELMRLGAAGFISKPFINIESLLRTLAA